MMKQALAGFLVGLCACSAVVEAAEGTRPRIALVLSGGGARGLAHVGVLKELERMRVPYDCIVGTSMGAIAGGSFATGISTQEAEQRVVEADWKAVFADKAKRQDIPYFRKEDDWKNYFDFVLTLKDLKLYTPKNVIGVQNIGLFFRELTGAEYSSNFDELPVPYRAVGTDIVTGEAVIINDGTVADAMRASMSIPGVFPPINYKGHLLVDGGIAKNIPVDTARELCGDVVIVVNVSTPSFRQDQLDSFFNIGQQVVSIAMQRNMDEQLRLVRPKDVLIVPEFGELTAADFEKVRDFIRLGEESARAVAPQLQRYVVSEAEYADWRANIEARKQPPPVIREVTMAPTQWVQPQVMSRLLDVHKGEPFDMERLHQNIAGVYARNDFTSISYEIKPLPGEGNEAEMVITPQERPGRDFVRAGIKLESDFSNSSDFGLQASLRRVWLNRFDGEWTTDAEVGSNQRVYSEWFQPLALEGEFFIAPYARYDNELRDVVVDSIAVSEYEVKRYGAGLELGSTIAQWGQVRLGAFSGRASLEPSLGVPLGNFKEKRSGYTLRSIYDQFDNPRFPYNGSAVHLNGFFANRDWGASSSWRWLDLDARTAFTYGRNTVLLVSRIGYSMDTEVPYYDKFFLGGLFNLSAYQKWALFDNNVVYGRAQFYRQIATLPSVVGRGLYGGVVGEAGKVMSNQQMHELDLGDMKFSGGLYFAADTKLGPFYLAAMRGTDNQTAIYLSLGMNY